MLRLKALIQDFVHFEVRVTLEDPQTKKVYTTPAAGLLQNQEMMAKLNVEDCGQIAFHAGAMLMEKQYAKSLDIS
jgi:hypothetical protein